MIVLSVIALSIVLAISALHFMWGARIWWPISDETQLVRATAGFPNADKMPPPAACFAVAFALLCVALLLVFEITQAAPGKLVHVALLVAGLVFLLRGLLGFTRFWARITPEHPFRTLDSRYYSPLCVFLGAVIVLTVWL